MYAALCALQMTAIITMMMMMMMMISDLLAGGIAVDVAVSEVGKVCTTAGEDTANCGSQDTTHLECPTGGGTCFCQTGFTGPIGGDCSE